MVALGVLHSNHVVHAFKGGQLGQSVFWEWRYFDDELKMRDQQWRWRGDNQRMGTWDRLSAAWSLSQDAWLRCTGPATMQGHVREFSCQTEAMLPLLLDIYARPGPRSTRREVAKDIAIRMLTLSVKGIYSITGNSRYSIDSNGSYSINSNDSYSIINNSRHSIDSNEASLASEWLMCA